MDSRKWDAYLQFGHHDADDVARDPADIDRQRSFISVFHERLPLHRSDGTPARVLAPGALTEAVMLAEAGYNVHALVLGCVNLRWLDEAKNGLPDPDQLVARKRDAHDLDYPASCFDGYFTVQVHEHFIAPFIHIGEVRHVLRDGGVVFVDACGTTNAACKAPWHPNLVPAKVVREQWEFWGFQVVWEGPEGDDRPQFVFEKLPIGHPNFLNSEVIRHFEDVRSRLV